MKMDVDIPAAASSFAEVEAGQLFTFRAGDSDCMAIAALDGQDRCAIVLEGLSGSPKRVDAADLNGGMVMAFPGASARVDLASASETATPGALASVAGAHFVCVADGDQLDYFDVKTGARSEPDVSGAVYFPTWAIDIKVGDAFTQARRFQF
jgi:hypothetical protein